MDPDLALAQDLQSNSANLDWQQAAGSTISLMGMHHIWMHNVIPLIPQFTELTGIEVIAQIQSEPRYVANLTETLELGRSKPDLIMVWSLPDALQKNWLEPLDQYFDNSEIYSADWYDADDLVPSARSIGVGPDAQQYGLPVTAEAQTLFINRQLASNINAGPPQTFDELYKLAVSLKSGPTAGIAMRARASDHASPWPAAGFVFSFGGRILSEDGAVVLDSPEAIEAVALYSQLLKDAGPADPGEYDWLECLNDFMGARAAIGCDSSNFATDIGDPKKSLVAGQAYYGLMPSQPGKDPIPNVWHWLVGINANSNHKIAAWLFLQWATSKSTMLRMAQRGMTTPRISALESPEFKAAFGEQAAAATLGNLMYADGELMKAAWYHPKASKILTPFAIAINEVVTGQKTAEAAMINATNEANAAILV